MTKAKFTNNDVWEMFIKTFTGEPDLEVTKVDNEYITFKLDPTKALDLFKSPEAVKATVMHAYSSTVKGRSYLSLSGEETLNELVNSNFLTDLKLSFNPGICKDNTVTKVMTCALNANSVFKFKQSVDGYKALQSLLRSEDQVSSILRGSSKILREEDFTGEESSYGEAIIDINIDQKEVSINYNKVISSAEMARVKTPALLEDTIGEYKLAKDEVLSHVQEVIPSGIMYKQLSDGQLQPILFQSLQADKPNNFQRTNLDFIIDISASMTDDLPEISIKLIELITNIIDNTNNWTFSITPFSSSVYSTETFSSDIFNIDDISNYINSLNTVYSTVLYDAMKEIYSKKISQVSSSVNNVVFTITDGKDNGSSSNAREIIKLSETLREVSPQSTLYNVGYASYSKTFFNNLSENTAAKTVHLDVPEDLEDLYYEVKTLNNCKVMYEFSSNQYAQCAAGDIFIPSFTVDQHTQVTVTGESYNTGFVQEVI